MSRKGQLLKLSSLITILFFSNSAQAELSMGLLTGMAQYTTELRGDAVYNFNGIGSQGYFQYPGDYASTHGVVGVNLRYLFPIWQRFGMGMETGYNYFHVKQTKLRADDLNSNNQSFSVEKFTTRSNGLINLNVVLSVLLAPTLSFNLFGGPAWLNTQYMSNDFIHAFRSSAPSKYQLTGALGAETDWQFHPTAALGMRFDYIFNTQQRIISRSGSATAVDNLPLIKPDVTKSGVILYTLTLRYLVPCM